VQIAVEGIDRVAGESYDVRYVEGIRHFNARDFFEAHEVWEDLWRDERGASRGYYQGLIQAAVCLYHFGRGNTRGAKKLYHSSHGYLDAYRPHYLGLDLNRLLSDLDRCCAELAACPEDTPRASLQPELIPALYLEPETDGLP
jgi:predicted metal-dependent hydrolase